MSQRLDYQSRSPAGMKALGEVYAYVAGCGLEKPLMDLVYLRASQINGCTYCIDTHAKDLLGAGTPARKLLLLSSWREASPWFTPREQAALSWTEAVTEVATSHVPDAAFQAARTQFDEKEMADLTIGIGLINTYNRIAISFRRSPTAPLKA
ncbi:carboxymuconolactone decarboxylase family protein [Methylobacterium sp. BTF04]|uniref:carboxymuconolactone decarboxylase family protein n=1 Tax=Methylobacterium sp. BTF04 TaxID=2708300 RepID=UPI0013D72608|nr:carboxymuconolactone decarboxylase family protein [Methylobacterium sp. BTF04]NEU12116.1 carboxymuconolactone decarboxylase family protein [Methylobacterium sp. BTF04]